MMEYEDELDEMDEQAAAFQEFTSDVMRDHEIALAEERVRVLEAVLNLMDLMDDPDEAIRELLKEAKEEVETISGSGNPENR